MAEGDLSTRFSRNSGYTIKGGVLLGGALSRSITARFFMYVTQTTGELVPFLRFVAATTTPPIF